MCIYTDASDSHWSAMLTHIQRDKKFLPHDEQSQEPRALLLDRFLKTHLRWSELDKKTPAEVASIKRSGWLVFCNDVFDSFTDYSSLIFNFDSFP